MIPMGWQPPEAAGRDGPMSNDAAQRIRDFIVESFLLGDAQGFDVHASLVDSGVLDSTGVMEVVDFLEETFSITIEPEDLTVDNLDSVDRLARLVEGKQRTAA
jgi:acyl carrier protein